MSGSVNLVILVGNCGKDPEVRTLASGDKLVNLTVATSEHWTDKASGEKKEKTEWHRIVCFNDRTCGVIEKYVRKGMKLYVEGSLQTRKWTDQQGQERYSTEIVIGRFSGKLEMLSKLPEAAEPEAYHAATPDAYQPRPSRPAPRTGGRQSELDDAIPFGACWQ